MTTTKKYFQNQNNKTLIKDNRAHCYRFQNHFLTVCAFASRLKKVMKAYVCVSSKSIQAVCENIKLTERGVHAGRCTSTQKYCSSKCSISGPQDSRCRESTFGEQTEETRFA